MPRLTIKLDDGDKEIGVPAGKRLVLAIEDAGVDIGHRCGGFAKCTTCKCEISAGEPNKMTQAEKEKNPQGFRLSCQMTIETDMTVRPLKRVKDTDWTDAGRRPQDVITPDPVWIQL